MGGQQQLHLLVPRRLEPSDPKVRPSSLPAHAALSTSAFTATLSPPPPSPPSPPLSPRLRRHRHSLRHRHITTTQTPLPPVHHPLRVAALTIGIATVSFALSLTTATLAPPSAPPPLPPSPSHPA